MRRVKANRSLLVRWPRQRLHVTLKVRLRLLTRLRPLLTLIVRCISLLATLIPRCLLCGSLKRATWYGSLVSDLIVFRDIVKWKTRRPLSMLVGLMFGIILKSSMVLLFPRLPEVSLHLRLGSFGQRMDPINGRSSRQSETVCVPLRRWLTCKVSARTL